MIWEAKHAFGESMVACSSLLPYRYCFRIELLQKWQRSLPRPDPTSNSSSLSSSTTSLLLLPLIFSFFQNYPLLFSAQKRRLGAGAGAIMRGDSDSTHWSELGSSHIQDQISISIGYSETKWCLGGEKMWVVV
ncbi:unnamed protein product, partial [Vitis vinifera]